MVHQTKEELLADLEGIIKIKELLAGRETLEILNEAALRDKTIDKLAFDAVFGPPEVLAKARFLLWEIGQTLGIIPTSNHDFYMARGRGEYSGLTMPSINARGIAYYTARAALRAALKNNVRAIQFELARSEIGYTAQRPAEYTAILLAAAIKEGFRGPLFILADHFQVKEKKYKENPEKEVGEIKELMKEAAAAGWLSFDIDASTLVDLKKGTLDEQQKVNYALSAELTQYARSLEPKEITFGLGVEIGEIGEKNSTPEELRTFMEGYKKTLKKLDPDLEGICKISVQTGTAHGGVVLPDGTLAQVEVDFETLKNLSKVAREEYGLGGVVQHGASTLPQEAFHLFPQKETCEIHLATEFQNIIYDHELFPQDLKEEMYKYLLENHRAERKEGQTDEQFFYKLRKQALGPFKKELWNLPEVVKSAIGEALEKKFSFLFEQLNVFNTKDLVSKFTKPIKVKKTEEDFKQDLKDTQKDTKGLAD